MALEPFRVADETFVIPAVHAVPGHGVLHMNAMVIRSREPVLIDTGMPKHRGAYLEAAFSLVNPRDVRWIFLSHNDPDHSGNLMEVLAACPNATLLTNYVGIGKLTEVLDIPMPRVMFMNNGDSFSVGDRTLVAMRPPLWDQPGTRGIWDASTGVYYAADSFGAAIPEHRERVDDLPWDVYEDGFNWFNRANHTWHELADPKKVEAEVDRLRQLAPRVIVSGHGPVAHGRSEQLFRMIAAIPTLPPVDEPSQRDLEALLEGHAGDDGAAPPAQPGGSAS